MRKVLALLLLTFGIGSCASMDPSVNDLKTPCVSNSDHMIKGPSQIPCERRKLIENFIV